MPEKPLIGIMVASLTPLPEYQIAGSLGADLFIFSPFSISWSNRIIGGWLFADDVWVKTAKPFPSAVYNRCYPTRRSLVNKLEKTIGEGQIFNYQTKFNKLTIYRVLQNPEVRDLLPDTYPYNENVFFDLLKNYKTMILKPCLGCLGRKVYRVEMSGNKEFLLYFKTEIPRFTSTSEKVFLAEINKLVGYEKFILQQYINIDKINGLIYDIRLFVQKNGRGKWNVSGGCSRVSLKNYFVTNSPRRIKSLHEITLSDNLCTEESLQEMKIAGLKVAEIAEARLGHLGEISVDFALDTNGRAWLIELNGMPQKSFLARLKDEELTKTIYSRPLEYALYLAGRRSCQPDTSSAILSSGQP